MKYPNDKQKTICGIIGNPLKHSLSPVMHNTAFFSMNLNFEYNVYEITEDELIQTLDALRTKNFRGLNVTHPFKIKIMDHLDFIDENAREIGSINTIVNEGGKLTGYNTDSEGAISALMKSGLDLEQTQNKVLIFGAGGATRAVAHPLVRNKQQLYIANRTHLKAQRLCNLLKPFGEAHAIEIDRIPEIIKEVNILINCTPLGMIGGPKGTLISRDLIHSDLIVFDMVYNPKETPLIKVAKEKGAKVIYGLEMFVLQGVLAFELWTNKKAPLEIMRKTVLEGLKDS